ncbi:tRNA pseudouridine(38-40) synthase TruA [Candidatus Erwinia haradaeae]|uniref:tRNA pseudouridine synthase A n=1 Tax=Candidatus Erwinia haradaeae TaxID=1922217 RepID=A0A451DPK7_9GAMM|nr:tRNA pseudouridine(38-40) synthase TruA [Candidatus Erwinia haradaeae]VFP88689.1 tRNA pseudouridine synthase A [Candidatus Erwinia haradaeae]
MLNSIIKLAFGIEYNGTHYCGWQRQREASSVQEELERAISKVANHVIDVVCAGRTDSGVHAIGQVIHFETTSERKNISWIRGVNSYLPTDIVVCWVKVMPNGFHARFSAISRSYRYIIYNHPYHRPAIFSGGVAYYNDFLDTDKMQRSAQCLLGENDFTSFRSSQCQSKSSKRYVIDLTVTRRGLYVLIDIQANSFVHHMVRNIVGSLIEVGCGHQPENWISNILLHKDRQLAAGTAYSHGLYLMLVRYPIHYEVPQSLAEDFFLISLLS